MTSSARLAIAVAASIAAAASPASAGGAKVPLGADIEAAAVSAPGGSVEYLTRRAGRATVVEARDRPSGDLLRAVRLSGHYAVPAVAYDGSAGGLSADGRTLFLADARNRFPSASTTFAILDAKRLRPRGVLRLPGDFSFDALSPDGSLLYLINYLSPRDETRYRVRVYDLGARRLLAKPVVDPNEPPDEMSGRPITRATSPGGRWAYTLYDGTEHPFIHALDTERRRAVCIDLDLGGTAPRRGLYGLRLDVPSGGSPLRVLAGQRVLASVDTETFRVTEPGAGARAADAADGDTGASAPWLLVGGAAVLVLTAAFWAVRIRRLGRVDVAGAGAAAPKPPEPGAPARESPAGAAR
jgi:hypothetical protein